MQKSSRALGLAALSLLELSPPDLVDVAADAGFDFVSLRIRPVTAEETQFDLSPGSPLLAATVERMRARGVWCSDGDLVRLDGTIGPQQWRPTLEIAATIGARAVASTIVDDDPARAQDSVAALAADARELGLTVALEPMSYMALSSVVEAGRLARLHGGRVILDCLHLTRAGATPAQVGEVVDVVSVLQLCDGPMAGPPDRAGLVSESRSERLAPGMGEFGLASLVAQVPTNLPVAVEVPSITERRGRSPVEYARFLRQRAEAVLAVAVVGG